MRKPQRLSMDELAPYVVDFHRPNPRSGAILPERPLEWGTLFGNDHPVEVEVGFGKGMYLVNAAMEHPETNYFGIEIVRKYQLYAAGRIAKRKLRNAITACADAKLVLNEHMPAGSVHAVHVYFPDPWWKARHKKRLLFTDDFADMIARVLKPGGLLHFVTDVSDYFDMVTGLLATKPIFQIVRFPETQAPRHDMDYLTNFERKFRLEGRPIHRAEYVKDASAL